MTDAAAMAHIIRDEKLDTRILADGYCASSCPLVFAGGVKRIADATSWIGVHQVFALTTAFGSLADGMEQAQMVSAEAQDLLHRASASIRWSGRAPWRRRRRSSTSSRRRS